MRNQVLIDEFHIGVFGKSEFPERQFLGMRTTLNKKRFQAALRRAVRKVINSFPILRMTRIQITR